MSLVPSEIVERQWLVRAMDSRLAEGHHLLVLSGNSGCGKTTAMRALRERLANCGERVLSFECPTSDEERRLGSARRLMLALASQAIEIDPSDSVARRQLERVLNGSLLASADIDEIAGDLLGPYLDELARVGAPVFVLVDGIDQDEGHRAQSASTLLSRLVQSTGSGVRVVTSAMTGSTALQAFSGQLYGVLSFSDPAFRDEVRRDLRSYLDGRGVTASISGADAARWVDAAEGSFYMLDAVVGGAGDAEGASAAVLGIGRSVVKVLARFEAAHRSRAENLLAVIAQLQAPLPLAFVAAVVNMQVSEAEKFIERMSPVIRVSDEGKLVDVSHWKYSEQIGSQLRAIADGAAGWVWSALRAVVEDRGDQYHPPRVREYAYRYGSLHYLRTLTQVALRRIAPPDDVVLDRLFQRQLRSSGIDAPAVGTGAAASGSRVGVAIAELLIADAHVTRSERRRARRVKQVRRHPSAEVRQGLVLAVEQLNELDPPVTAAMFRGLLAGSARDRISGAAVLVPFLTHRPLRAVTLEVFARVPPWQARAAADAILSSWQHAMGDPSEVLVEASGRLDRALGDDRPRLGGLRWLVFAAQLSLAAFYRDTAHTPTAVVIADMWTRILQARRRRVRALIAWAGTRVIGSRLGRQFRALGAGDPRRRSDATPAIAEFAKSGNLDGVDPAEMWQSLDSDDGYEVFVALFALSRLLLGDGPAPWLSQPPVALGTVRARRWASALVCVCESYPDVAPARREFLARIVAWNGAPRDEPQWRGNQTLPLFIGEILLGSVAQSSSLLEALLRENEQPPDGHATPLAAEFFDSLAIASYFQRDTITELLAYDRFADLLTEKRVAAHVRAFNIVEWNLPAARRHRTTSAIATSEELRWAHSCYETIGLLGAAVELARYYPKIAEGVIVPNLEAFATLGSSRRMDWQMSESSYQSLRREEFNMSALLSDRQDRFRG